MEEMIIFCLFLYGIGWNAWDNNLAAAVWAAIAFIYWLNSIV